MKKFSLTQEQVTKEGDGLSTQTSTTDHIKEHISGLWNNSDSSLSGFSVGFFINEEKVIWHQLELGE